MNLAKSNIHEIQPRISSSPSPRPKSPRVVGTYNYYLQGKSKSPPSPSSKEVLLGTDDPTIQYPSTSSKPSQNHFQ